MRFAALATIALVLISGVALPQSLDEQVSQLLAENKPLEAASIAKQAIEQSTTNEGPEHPVTKNDSLSHQLFRSLHGLRDWKDRTGEYTITAHFIEMKDGNVRLLMPGGKTKVVALDKLSPADRQHVEQVAKMKAQLAASNLALPKPAAGDIQNPSGPVPTQNELPVKGLSGQARVATEAPQSPEAAILGFFSIPTIRWRERLPYVADIDLAEKYMAEIYGRVASRDVASNFAITSIGADRSSARAGDDLPFRCSYVMRGENDERVIFVTKTVDGFKVNWMRSYHPWLLQNTPEGVVYRWYVGQKTADRLLPLCANPDEAKLLINKYCDDPKYAGGPGGLSHADTHEPLPVTFFSDDYAKFLSNSSDPFRMLFITKENFEKKMAEQVWVDPSPVFAPVLMRELGNSPRGVSEGGAQPRP